MGTRLRHRLRKFAAAGKLFVSGRAPSWMQALPAVEEAGPEEVEQYLAQPAGILNAELVSNEYCVGINRKTGKALVSGVYCLSPENWDIVKKGSIEDCMRYARAL